ncbi:MULTISPECIES: RteC domain-containing protein [Christiangramia]|uniref:Tetracycline resistance element mobilization regulatory protein rteC n=1 Tax=Christiangramia flava JLT2011 TaxID=1229726 RepID=A0A1L7I371_9FLAO|nr:RteC domain-containing protein [Christiangramia flava]APU67633.1 Tetracycline resistance element mobilization regulatory protein rteC [Christiangramia flava JLT2011]OSS37673.1 putative regulatory protein RteC [Christiangramia flava JLT2011]
MFEEVMTLFSNKLDLIVRSANSHLKKSEKGIQLCNNTISQLQHLVEQEDFENTGEEINFFKNIKPFPMSYLIYFTEIRTCELSIPKVGKTHKIRYLEKEVKKVNKFFARNNDFVHYMEQDYGYLDHQFFCRNYRNNFPFTPTINYYQYPEFTTSHDMLWAKIQALYRFIHYLRERLQELEPGNDYLYQEKRPTVLVWSGSKTALVELVYALYASQDINHGTADIKTLVAAFEDFFNIRLDNFYKTYSEIKARKKDRTKYLATLMLKLEERIYRDDQ